eukprot:2377770-Rhodomonas_salina.7
MTVRSALRLWLPALVSAPTATKRLFAGVTVKTPSQPTLSRRYRTANIANSLANNGSAHSLSQKSYYSRAFDSHASRLHVTDLYAHVPGPVELCSNPKSTARC